MEHAERDRIELRAQVFFRQLYTDQGDRTIEMVMEDDARMTQAINNLYLGEAKRGADAFFAFWQGIALLVAGGALSEANTPLTNPVYDEAGDLAPFVASNLDKFLREMSVIFGDRYSQNSLRLTFEVIDKWKAEGGDIQRLRDALRPVWDGPRPNAAATTETTRVVNMARQQAYVDAGFWGYRVNTRNDQLVRPEHQAIADQSPYPAADTDHRPPFATLFRDPGLSINCRCDIVAVVEDPNG